MMVFMRSEQVMKEKYISVFMQAFNLDRDEVDGSVAMGKTEGWDSVGHVQFISLIEDTFDIMLDAGDIINFNSYEAGLDILRKYGVDIEQ